MSNDDFFNQLGDFISKGTQNIRDRLTMDVTDLLRAIDKNDPDAVERALQAKVDPNSTDGIRRRALPIATDNNHLLIVQLLLKAGADPNLPDPFGDVPLFKAVYWENEEIASALLAAGADIHLASANGNSPLEEAHKLGYTEMAELLVHYQDKARKDQISKDKALHEEMKEKAKAARKAREEKAAQELLAQQQAAAAAQAAAQLRAEKEVAEKYIVAEGDYAKALIEAINSDDTEGAKILLDKTIDIDAYVPEYRNTPLFAAIEHKNTVITRLLIERGADALSVNMEKQHSPLSLAVSLGAHKLVDFIITQRGGDVSASLNHPEQLLSAQFIAYKDPKMLNLLLRGGADPFYGGKHGQAPVVKAIDKGSLAVLPVLVANNIDLNRRYEELSLLEWAIHYRRIDWVSALLAEEVNPDSQNEAGRTALMFAVEINFVEAVALLLEEDADIYLRDEQGRTAEEIAQELGGREEVLEMLNDQ